LFGVEKISIVVFFFVSEKISISGRFFFTTGFVGSGAKISIFVIFTFGAGLLTPEDPPKISISEKSTLGAAGLATGVEVEEEPPKISILEKSTFGAAGLATGVEVVGEKISISDISTFLGGFEGVKVGGEAKLTSLAGALVLCTGLD